MSKVLVLYYSSHGHTERMAQAVAEGVREACAEADIKRVPELVSANVAKKSGYKLDQAAPIAAVAELPNYDAIVFGSGTRFGVVTSQMRRQATDMNPFACRDLGLRSNLSPDGFSVAAASYTPPNSASRPPPAILRQPITPQLIPSRFYMQRDASSFAVGAEL